MLGLRRVHRLLSAVKMPPPSWFALVPDMVLCSALIIASATPFCFCTM